MPDFDVIIKDGLIFDGARNPRFRADIGIKDGVIATMGRLHASDGRKVIDASGLRVAPGFVDLHTHYDSQLFWDPYCSISGWHGVTSVVIGNCGFGFAPVAPENRDRAMLTMARNEAVPLACMQAGMPWDWVTFPEFLDSVESASKAVNVLPYMPLSPLLTWVMGIEDSKAGRMPTDAEHAEMRRLLNEAMDAGACGWSVQRLGQDSFQRDYDGTPMATDIMHSETCLELARVLADRNDGFIQLTVDSSDPKCDLGHIEALADISGRPIIWNAILARNEFPNMHRTTIAWLRSCMERGLKVYGQAITTDAPVTFTFEDWNIWDYSPTWREATLGTVEERLTKLADPDRRPGLKANPPHVLATGPMDQLVVMRAHTPETKRYENLKIGEVCALTGKDPVDALLDIAVADGLRTVFFTDSIEGSRQYQRELIDFEYGIPGVSDGGAHTKFATGGIYPTDFITKYVRDLAWLSPEEAHWRLSAFPAHCAGFRGRGVLREGAPADVVVYDYEALQILPQEIAHDYPAGEWRRIQRARGYRNILVNGEVTIEDDKETGASPGKLLRHGVGRPAAVVG
jgi:N-acyl-D-aspartate/D-glutamate deacylase